MDWRRIAKNFFTWPSLAQRCYPPPGMTAITDAIHESEKQHLGQVRFVVESNLPFWAVIADVSARERAIDHFGQLRVWDTEDNNGILVYLLLAEHRVEIVADRGVSGKVTQEEWQEACRLMQERLKQRQYVDAALAGIAKLTEYLQRHYPNTGGNVDELPNEPVIL